MYTINILGVLDQELEYIVISLLIGEFLWLIACLKGIVFSIWLNYNKICWDKNSVLQRQLSRTNRVPRQTSARAKPEVFFLNAYRSDISEDIWINKHILETLHYTENRKKLK